MLKATNNPIIPNFSPSKYQAMGQEFPRGDARRTMSRSELCKFGVLPSKWIRGTEEESNKSLDHGSLVDCLLLTPDLCEHTYCVVPDTYTAKGKKKDDPSEEKPWNRNATFCKEWEASIIQSGQTPIKSVDLNTANTAIRRLKEDTAIMALIDSSDKQVLIQVEWRDDATGLVIPIKCLIDLLPHPESPFSNVVADLKTSKDASLREYSKSIFTHGYHVQAALYLDAFNLVSNGQRNEFRHIVSENTTPFETAKRWISEEFIEIGRTTYKTLLHQYCQCLGNDYWPGYDEWNAETVVNGWGCVSPSSWMILEQ